MFCITSCCDDAPPRLNGLFMLSSFLPSGRGFSQPLSLVVRINTSYVIVNLYGLFSLFALSVDFGRLAGPLGFVFFVQLNDLSVDILCAIRVLVLCVHSGYIGKAIHFVAKLLVRLTSFFSAFLSLVP